MKILFPQYADISIEKHEKAWTAGIFIFDTSVILNLYRYKQDTSDGLLNAIKLIKNRKWIPYNVVVEFYRNRLNVIADQNKKFIEVKSIINESKNKLNSDLTGLDLLKRHYSIKIDPFIEKYNVLVSEFIDELTKLEETHQKLTSQDKVKNSIESLFENCIGSSPEDQSWVDAVYKEAEWRFGLSIPPGYEDRAKELSKNAPSHYLHNGIIYQRKFGDFLIWKQILEFAKGFKEKRSVIFISDDHKDDWWLKIDSKGRQTIGPRPELVEEIYSTGNVDYFQMYTSENFLKHAKQYLKANVSESTIEEVHLVSIHDKGKRIHNRHSILGSDVETAICNWISQQGYNVIRKNKFEFPDILAVSDGELYGFEIKFVNYNIASEINILYDRASKAIVKEKFKEITIIFVTLDTTENDRLRTYIKRTLPENLSEKVAILTGVYDSNLDEFTPYTKF